MEEFLFLGLLFTTDFFLLRLLYYRLLFFITDFRGNYSMSIVKNTPHILKHSGSYFTTLLNSTIEAIKDPATLGMYVYLAAKPHDWEISETNLKNRFGKGRDFIRARMSDLKRIGLLKSIAIKDDKGRIVRWETVLYNEVQIPENPECGEVDVQMTENPPSGETRRLVDPPTTNKRSLKIKDLNNHTHSVEHDLFLDSEKQRLALMLRQRSLKHEKCHGLYDKLPSEIKEEKSFEDMLDECVTHYATEADPKMVSPQRLMSWIKREIRYQESLKQTKPNLPQRSGDSFNQFMNSQKQGKTYDQHGNTFDPFR